MTLLDITERIEKAQFQEAKKKFWQEVKQFALKEVEDLFSEDGVKGAKMPSKRENLYVDFLVEFFVKLNATCKSPEIRTEATSLVMQGLRELWAAEDAKPEERAGLEEVFKETLRKGWAYAKELQKDYFVFATMLMVNYERIAKEDAEIAELAPSEDEVAEDQSPSDE